MGAQNRLLSEHGSGGRVFGLCCIRLLVGQSAGGSRICPRGISAATAHPSRDRQTAGRDHSGHPRLAQVQRVGVCRIHIRLDLGIYRALPGPRRPASVHAPDTAGTARGFLCNPAGESRIVV